MSSSRRKSPTVGAKPTKVREAAKSPHRTGRVEITVNGVRVEVSPELEAAVHRAYKGLFQLPKEMTTTQAAEFLDVSRPFVVKLIKRGELPCRMIGKHRRIPTDALREYRDKMFQRARAAADEMVRISEESGLCEIEGPLPRAR